MASTEEVFLCGRCNGYEATVLEDFVAHMSKCVVPQSKKKDEKNKVECEVEIVLDDSENSDDAIECEDISEDAESPQKEKRLRNTMVSSQNQYHSPTTKDGRSSPLLFIWSKQTAEFLFGLIKSHREDMQSNLIRRRVVWQRIAMEMEEKYGYCVSATQCENKFKSMIKRYRQCRDNNLRPSCKIKQTCLLYNELDEYFKDDPRFQLKKDSESKTIRRDSESQTRRDYVSYLNYHKSLGTSKYIDFYNACVGKKQVRISEGGDSNSYEKSSQNEADQISCQNESDKKSCQNETDKISCQNETEPLWVKRMMETFEKCHRENMKMQREFINELKKILEKT